MNHEIIDDLAIQAGLACDGTDFDRDATRLFAHMILQSALDYLFYNGCETNTLQELYEAQ